MAFIYSALFFLLTPLFTPAEATILGVRWADGGEALLCALYAGLLCCSAFWLPLTVRAITNDCATNSSLFCHDVVVICNTTNNKNNTNEIHTYHNTTNTIIRTNYGLRVYNNN